MVLAGTRREDRMRTTRKKKPVGRTRADQRRPVLAARVPEEFLARIQASARAHGRNASEELMWLADFRVAALAEGEEAGAIVRRAYDEASAVLAAADRLTIDTAGLEELLERAVTRALERAGVVTGGHAMTIKDDAHKWRLAQAQKLID